MKLVKMICVVYFENYFIWEEGENVMESRYYCRKCILFADALRIHIILCSIHSDL